MTSTIGWNVVSNHVQIVACSTFESRLLDADVQASKIHLFLRQDFGVTKALGVDGILSILQEKTEGVAGRSLYMIELEPASTRNHCLLGSRDSFQAACDRNIEARECK